MKLTLILLTALLLTGCIGNKTNPNKYTDKVTGREYNQEQWDNLSKDEQEAIRQGNQETAEGETYIDKLLAAPILIIFSIGALVFMIAAAYCFMQKPLPNLKGAVACVVLAFLTAVLPAAIALFWKGGVILLYIAAGFTVVCAAIGIWFFYQRMKRKHDAELNDKTTALNGVLDTVDEIKTAIPDQWLDIRDTIVQCPVTKAAVKDYKNSK